MADLLAADCRRSRRRVDRDRRRGSSAAAGYGVETRRGCYHDGGRRQDRGTFAARFRRRSGWARPGAGRAARTRRGTGDRLRSVRKAAEDDRAAGIGGRNGRGDGRECRVAAAPDASSEDAGAPDSAESGGHVAEVVSGGAPAEAAAAVSGGESETGRKRASDGRATNVGSRAADNGGRTGGVAARSAAAGGSLYAVRGDARPASRPPARKRMSFSLSAGGGVSGDGGSAGRTPHFP